jgi:hypothetical protein
MVVVLCVPGPDPFVSVVPLLVVFEPLPALVPGPDPLLKVEPSFFDAQPQARAHTRPAVDRRESVEVRPNLIGSSAT